MNTSVPLFNRLGGAPALQVLLRHFYADVRQHRVLGPIFAAHIENWPAHLEKIAGFWSQVTGGPAVYSGSPPARHLPLNLQAEHFQAWLGLWDVNCRLWLAPDCAAEMSALAAQIGRRLRQVCQVPAPPVLQFNFRPATPA